MSAEIAVGTRHWLTLISSHEYLSIEGSLRVSPHDGRMHFDGTFDRNAGL